MTKMISCIGASLVLMSCGGTAATLTPSNEAPRELPESRALALIARTLGRSGAQISNDWDVDVGVTAPLRVDVRIGRSTFGVEYVTAQDRADMGEVIPQPDPDGQLRILRGVRETADAQVLIVDSKSYLYDEHIEHVQEGAPGIRDVEGRLARDVEDFVVYARGQGLP